MSKATATAVRAPKSQRVIAWLQIVAVLPVMLWWASLGLGYVALVLPGIAIQVWHGTPERLETSAWLFTGLFLGGGFGLLALLSALVPVACGLAAAYRLARWERVGLVVGFVVSLYWLVGLAMRVSTVNESLLAVLLFGLPCIVAVNLMLRIRRERGVQ